MTATLLRTWKVRADPGSTKYSVCTYPVCVKEGTGVNRKDTEKDTEKYTENDTEQPKSSSASELVPILAPRRAAKDGCIPISKSCAQHRIPALHTLWRIASLSSLMLMLFGHSNLSKLPRQKFVQRSLTRAKSCSLSSTNTVHHDA